MQILKRKSNFWLHFQGFPIHLKDLQIELKKPDAIKQKRNA
jgi:hypothetical protein